MFAVILIYWHSLVFISMYFKGLLYNICFVVLFLISWILKNTDKWEHRHCFKYFVASTTELNCDMVPPLCASKHSVWNLQLSSLANYLHCYFFLAGCVLWSLFCTPARVELRSCHVCAWLRTRYKQAWSHSHLRAFRLTWCVWFMLHRYTLIPTSHQTHGITDISDLLTITPHLLHFRGIYFTIHSIKITWQLK